MVARTRLFAACYAASGAAALVYEVTWTRLLTLQMGHTVAAVSTVLAAFMGGLAAGAWLAGLFPIPSTRRLHAYAALEVVVALAAIAIPLLLRAFVPALAWAYADGTAPARFAFVRVSLAFALLAVPAAAMGATFPIAAAWFSAAKASVTPDGRDRPAADAGLLYAANTAGAAAGAIGAGFWLIPAIGLRGATWAGVVLNAVAALGALSLARPSATDAPSEQWGAPKPHARKGGGARSREPARATDSPRPWLASSAAALSGFAALVYEVALTRLLALVIGPTTYAFATMAASFICGIALGSAAGTRVARRVGRPALWLAAMLVISAVSASMAASFAASRLPLIVASEVAASGATFQSIVMRQALDIGLLMLPLTFALGAAFPLALATASSGAASAVARDVARVYVANTLGAIAGALTAGFILVPRFGLQATFVGTSRAGAIGGLIVAGAVISSRARDRGRRLLWLSGLAAAGIALVVMLDIPRWDRELLSSGAYKYAPYIAAAGAAEFETSLRAGRLEYYAEGAAATVSVRRLGGRLALAIDGKVDASNAGDMLTQRMLGVLPVLLHDQPQELCVIGLGSGVTLASALRAAPFQRADVVEISPEVVAASAWFSTENGDVLHAPAVHLIIGDGRSHLQLTTHRYDIIVSEPSNPWMAGVAALFTREFFEAARARLKPGGLLCQWAHTYDMDSADLRSIVRTFASVFPQGTMWLVGDGDLLLVGAIGADLDARLARIGKRSRSASITTALADVELIPSAAPFQVLSMFAGAPAELARYGDGAAVQADDRMALEFSAPHWIYGKSTNTNGATIRALTAEGGRPEAIEAVMRAGGADSWKARGRMDLKAESYAAAYESFRRAATLDDRDVDALKGVSDAAGGANRQSDERAWLEALARTAPDNAAVRVELSRVRAAAHDFDGALAAASEAQRLEPDNPRAAEQRASILADMGDGERLQPFADALVARFPERDDSHYFHATALMLRGRTAEAADEARRIVARNPRHAKAQNLLGVACATAGEHDCAAKAFEASIRSNPREASTYVNLGLLYLQSADPATASDYFAEALALDPTSPAAKDGLAQARSARP